MSIPVDTSSNYMRGQIFRDLNTMKLNFKELYADPSFHGSEAFIFTMLKEEDEEGLMLSYLVFFGASDHGIVLLDGKNYLANVPYGKIEYFHPFSVNKPDYFFPPANTPKRAMLIEIKFRNEQGLMRTLMLVFPEPALHAFELEYPSQDVHLQLMKANETNNFISDIPSNALQELSRIVGGNFIPNEINKNNCAINYYLGV